DVDGYLPPEIPLDPVLALDDLAEARHLVVGPLLHRAVQIDRARLEDPAGRGSPQAVDVGKGYLAPLVPRQIDAGDACHVGSPSCPSRSRRSRPAARPDGLRPAGGGRRDPHSSLTLLVAWVGADDPHDALAPDDLALLAPRLDRRTNFHARDSPLLEPVRDPALREIVGRQLPLPPLPPPHPHELHPPLPPA